MVAAVDRLTQLALEGRTDEVARAELVRAAYDQVWRLCAGLVDRAGADDLAQETFLRALRSLGRFRADASARTWLLAIARHTCVDELRARQRRRRHAADGGGGASGADAPDRAPDASQEALVADLLARLDPDRRAAFVVTQLLGLSYDEAATVCACPTGTIRSRVARARADLIELVGEEPASRGSRPAAT